MSVHVRGAHAARTVRLKALERIRVEQHRAAHPVRFGEKRHALVDARDARVGEQTRRAGAAFLGRLRDMG